MFVPEVEKTTVEFCNELLLSIYKAGFVPLEVTLNGTAPLVETKVSPCNDIFSEPITDCPVPVPPIITSSEPVIVKASFPLT